MARKERTGPGRFATFRRAYEEAKKTDPRLGPVVVAAGVVVLAVLLGIGFAVGHPILLGILGFLFGLVTALVVFNRRTERAMYVQMEGETGAAAGVLQMVEKRWDVTPVAGFTKSNDFVHRAVGRGGVVLVGEGNTNRVNNLLATEEKRIRRIDPDVPIRRIIVGNGEGEVPLRKLRATITRMPMNKLSGEQVGQLTKRLKAVGERPMPIPKGPLPKGARLPRGGRL